MEYAESLVDWVPRSACVGLPWRCLAQVAFSTWFKTVAPAAPPLPPAAPASTDLRVEPAITKLLCGISSKWQQQLRTPRVLILSLHGC